MESYQHYFILVIIIFHRLGLLCEINFVRGLPGLIVSGGRFFLPEDLLIFVLPVGPFDFFLHNYFIYFLNLSPKFQHLVKSGGRISDKAVI